MTSKSSVVLALVAGIAGCQRSPVEWRVQPDRFVVTSGHDARATSGDARLVLRADQSPAIEPVAATPTSPAGADANACPAALRTAASTRRELYGVWWSRRENGTAALVAARSDDGGATWTRAVSVDTTDQWAVGCSRPAPAIAADSASGYVHVAYFLHGPDGPGVFFSHSMDRGSLFHAPVPILYGDRPAATAIAAADSVVVVALEDPNSKRGAVSLALSRTWGHTFTRERPQASGLESTAERPLIALRDSVIAVGWHGPDGSIIARVGTIGTR